MIRSLLPCRLLATGLALTSLVPGPARAQMAEHHERGAAENLDVRVNRQADLPKVAVRSSAQLQTRNQARALATGKAITRLKTLIPGAEATVSPVTGAPEIVKGPRTLTGPAPGKGGGEIVRGFLSDHADLYGLSAADLTGLHVIGESVSPGSGMRMVRVEQTVNGRPVFQSETRFTLTKDGQIIRSVGLMAADVTASAPPLTGLLSAPQALAAAVAPVGITIDPAAVTEQNTSADGFKTELVVNQGGITRNVTSEIVYFPAAPGSLIPAWSQVTFTSGEGDWYTLVDAWTGALLWRKNLRAHASAQDARFRVYVQADGTTPADSPAPLSPTNAAPGFQAPAIAPTIVSMHTAENPTASPNGWIDDHGTTTTGNNVDAYLDRVTANAELNSPDAGALDNNGRPTGNPDANSRSRDFLGTTPRDFQTNFLPPPQGGSPDAGQTAAGAPSTALNSFRRGVVTHLFYLANWYHDQLYNLGFDEAAGNFQQANFSGMGLGGDRVLAEADDDEGSASNGSNRNNANFSTPPDGQSGRMQMYVFDSPTINRDGSLDAEIVLHEMTHGLSNRLIGNGAGLNWSIGGGMGEGWSDFYALSLLNNTNADDPNGRYAMGGYATYQLGGLTNNYTYGIRRFPYCTDNSVNPLTWADVDQTTNSMSGGISVSPLNFNGNGALEVHNVGEVWCMTLWEVRSRIIATAGGDVPTGNHTSLQLITDALKLTPINPTFIEARDAILDADAATDAAANEASIWGGFADRGLGYGAASPFGYEFGFTSGHTGVHESFDLPYLDVQSVAIDDSQGNNNGTIDPGEPVKLTVKLKNPWRNPSKGVASATATLTTSTAGVVIADGTSAYPAISALGSADGDSFTVVIPTTATAGQSLRFTITPTSALGSHAVDFTLRVGTPSGNGAPVTYTHTIAGGLAIPDATPGGVVDSLTVTDDLEIADLNFRVDSLVHTFVGDLTVMLRGPNGTGTDLISATGAFDASNGSGDNFTNTVIDDQATQSLAAVLPAQAPFTGSWLPAFNAPAWNGPSLGTDTVSDPVGQLSRFNGTSTQGVWKVVVSDQFSQDTGTLFGWSLIVTPKAYAVTPFTPTSTLSATQTVSGTFLPGNTVTYTVTLTNNGTGVQPDNAGNEFSEVLPPQLDLVSAAANSGSATATVNSNTVTWNGSINPLGGSVTITINATIKAGLGGQSISAQGTVAYDADLNGSNEATTVTDDPGVGGTADPTRFNIPAPSIAGTQTVTGFFVAGGSVTYTVTLTNSGSGDQPDLSGDEFAEVLPAGLTLVSASASSGTAVANTGTNTVTWNGAIPSGSSLTITINATLNAGVSGQTISAQGSIAYDAFLAGSNGNSSLTDDPNVTGPINPTSFTVGRYEDFALLSGKKIVKIAVLGNDAALGANLTLVSTTNGAHGTVTVNSDGTLTYTPTEKLPAGGDSFTYTATDGTHTYTVTVQVNDYAEALAAYTGLITPSGVAVFGNNGLVRAKLSKTGAVTGSILLGGDKISFRGTIDSTGVAHFGKTAALTADLKRKNASTLELSLQLPLGGDLDSLLGTITDGVTPFASFTADRAFYTSKKNPLPPLLNVPASLVGKYTVIFRPKSAPNQGVAADHYPQGYGYAVLTVDKKGTAKLTGKLADGFAVSCANPISGIDWPFYVAFTRKLGSIGGAVTFEDTPTVSDLDGLNFNWFRLENPKAKTYPDGWPDGILTDLLGSKFVKPATALKVSILADLAAPLPGGNVAFTLADGDLPPPGEIDLDANVDGKNKVSFLSAPADLKLKLTLASSTGLVGGGFKHPANGKTSKLLGVVFQKQDSAFGYFLGPQESGRFELIAK